MDPDRLDLIDHSSPPPAPSQRTQDHVALVHRMNQLSNSPMASLEDPGALMGNVHSVKREWADLRDTLMAKLRELGQKQGYGSQLQAIQDVIRTTDANVKLLVESHAGELEWAALQSGIRRRTAAILNRIESEEPSVFPRSPSAITAQQSPPITPYPANRGRNVSTFAQSPDFLAKSAEEQLHFALSHIDLLEGEVSNLRVAIEEKNRRLERAEEIAKIAKELEGEVSTARLELDFQEKQLSDSGRVKSKINDLESALRTKTREIEEMAGRLRVAEDSRNKVIKRAEEILESKENFIREMGREMQELRDQLAENELGYSKHLARDQVGIKEAENAELRRQVSFLQTLVQEKERQIQLTIQNSTQTDASLDRSLRDEKERISSELRRSAETTRNLEMTIAELRTKVLDGEREARRGSDRARELESVIGKLEQRLRESDDRAKSFEMKLKDTEDRFRSREISVADAERRLNDERDRISTEKNRMASDLERRLQDEKSRIGHDAEKWLVDEKRRLGEERQELERKAAEERQRLTVDRENFQRHLQVAERELQTAFAAKRADLEKEIEEVRRRAQHDAALLIAHAETVRSPAHRPVSNGIFPMMDSISVFDFGSPTSLHRSGLGTERQLRDSLANELRKTLDEMRDLKMEISGLMVQIKDLDATVELQKFEMEKMTQSLAAERDRWGQEKEEMKLKFLALEERERKNIQFERERAAAAALEFKKQLSDEKAHGATALQDEKDRGNAAVQKVRELGVEELQAERERSVAALKEEREKSARAIERETARLEDLVNREKERCEALLSAESERTKKLGELLSNVLGHKSDLESAVKFSLNEIDTLTQDKISLGNRIGELTTQVNDEVTAKEEVLAAHAKSLAEISDHKLQITMLETQLEEKKKELKQKEQMTDQNQKRAETEHERLRGELESAQRHVQLAEDRGRDQLRRSEERMNLELENANSRARDLQTSLSSEKVRAEQLEQVVKLKIQEIEGLGRQVAAGEELKEKLAQTEETLQKKESLMRERERDIEALREQMVELDARVARKVREALSAKGEVMAELHRVVEEAKIADDKSKQLISLAEEKYRLQTNAAEEKIRELEKVLREEQSREDESAHLLRLKVVEAEELVKRLQTAEHSLEKLVVVEGHLAAKDLALKEKEAENKMIKEKLVDTEDKFKLCLTAKEQKVTELRRVEEECREARSGMERLQVKIVDAERRISDSQSAKEALTLQLQTVAGDGKEARADLSRLKSKLDTVEAKLRDVLAERDKATTERDSLNVQLKDTRNQISKFEVEKKETEIKIRNLDREMQEAKRRATEDIEALKKDVDSARRQTQRADDRARDQIALVEKESRDHIEVAYKKAHELQQRMTEEKSKIIDDLEAALKEKSSHIVSLERRVRIAEDASTKVVRLEEVSASKDRVIAEKSESIDQLSKRLQDSDGARQVLVAEKLKILDTLNQTTLQHKEDMKIADEKLDDLSKLISEEKNRSEELKKFVKTRSLEREELERRLKEAESVFEKFVRAEGALLQKESVIKQKEKDIFELREKLSEMQSAREAADHDHRLYIDEMKEARGKLERDFQRQLKEEKLRADTVVESLQKEKQQIEARLNVALAAKDSTKFEKDVATEESRRVLNSVEREREDTRRRLEESERQNVESVAELKRVIAKHELELGKSEEMRRATGERLQQITRSATEEKLSLEQALRQRESELAKLNRQLESTEGDLIRQLRDTAAEKEKLTLELRQSLQKSQGLESSLSAMQSERDGRLRDIAKLESEKEKSHGDLQRSVDKIKELEISISNLEAKVSAGERQREKRERDIAAAELALNFEREKLQVTMETVLQQSRVPDDKSSDPIRKVEARAVEAQRLLVDEKMRSQELQRRAQKADQIEAELRETQRKLSDSTAEIERLRVLAQKKLETQSPPNRPQESSFNGYADSVVSPAVNSAAPPQKGVTVSSEKALSPPSSWGEFFKQQPAAPVPRGRKSASLLGAS